MAESKSEETKWINTQKGKKHRFGLALVLPDGSVGPLLALPKHNWYAKPTPLHPRDTFGPCVWLKGCIEGAIQGGPEFNPFRDYGNALAVVVVGGTSYDLGDYKPMKTDSVAGGPDTPLPFKLRLAAWEGRFIKGKPAQPDGYLPAYVCPVIRDDAGDLNFGSHGRFKRVATPEEWNDLCGPIEMRYCDELRAGTLAWSRIFSTLRDTLALADKGDPAAKAVADFWEALPTPGYPEKILEHHDATSGRWEDLSFGKGGLFTLGRKVKMEGDEVSVKTVPHKDVAVFVRNLWDGHEDQAAREVFGGNTKAMWEFLETEIPWVFKNVYALVAYCLTLREDWKTDCEDWKTNCDNILKAWEKGGKTGPKPSLPPSPVPSALWDRINQVWFYRPRESPFAIPPSAAVSDTGAGAGAGAGSDSTPG